MTATPVPITDEALAAIKAQLTEERRENYAVMDFDVALALIARLDFAEKRLEMLGDELDMAEEESVDMENEFVPLDRSATEWRAARRAFLALPPNSPDARAALNRLANAESALMKGTNQ